METITRKTVTNLTAESVSILTQEFSVVDENQIQTLSHEEGETTPTETREVVQIGSNHRRAYSNSENGRAMLIANEPEDIVTEVLTVWGDAPTVEEPEIPVIEIKPTAEERISELENTVAEQNNALCEQVEYNAEMLFQISMLQLGI